MVVLDLELKSTLLNHELAVDYYERLVFFNHRRIKRLRKGVGEPGFVFLALRFLLFDPDALDPLLHYKHPLKRTGRRTSKLFFLIQLV